MHPRSGSCGVCLKASSHAARGPFKSVCRQTHRFSAKSCCGQGGKSLLADFTATILAAVVATTPLAPEAWAQVQHIYHNCHVNLSSNSPWGNVDICVVSSD